MKDYISVVYNENRVPLTDYPYKLASYLKSRFMISKANSELLELGPGRGEFLSAFRRLGLRCFALDRCESDIHSLYIIDLSTDRFPFRDESFDIVFHKSVIEHLPSADNIMRETYRVLRPSGRVIIMTPDWRSQMRVFYEDPTHIRPYDVTAVHDLLELYGFSDIESELFYQLPIAWKHSGIRAICRLLRLMLPVIAARATRIKFLRWSVELMVLGTGVK